MAKTTPPDKTAADLEPAPAAAPPSAASDLIAGLTQAITGAINQTGPIKQTPVTQYKGKSPWNPKGLRESKRPKFTREYWQNGAIVQRWHVNDDVALLNKLQPGRYLNRLVEVVSGTSAEGETPIAIEIRYNNKTQDQRSENKNAFRNFTDLLRQLVAEIEGVPVEA